MFFENEGQKTPRFWGQVFLICLWQPPRSGQKRKNPKILAKFGVFLGKTKLI